MIGVAKYLPLLASSLRRKRLRTFFTVASILIAFLLFGLRAVAAVRAEVGRRRGRRRPPADHAQGVVHAAAAGQLREPHPGGGRRGRGVAADLVRRLVPGRAQPVPGVPERPRGLPAHLPGDHAAARTRSRPGLPTAAARWSAAPSPTCTAGSSATGSRSSPRSGAARTAPTPGTSRSRAIYDLPEGGDTRQIVLHQDYFDEAKQQAKGLIGWYVIKVDDVDRAQADRASRSTRCSPTRRPRPRPRPSGRWRSRSSTRSATSARSSRRSSAAVFFTMLLVTANTMAQSVRERTSELGVLKTLGFSNGGVLGLVLGRVRAGHRARRPARHAASPGGSASSSRSTLEQYLPGFRVPPATFAAIAAVHGGARRGRGRGAGVAGDAPAHRRSAAARLSPHEPARRLQPARSP